MATEEDIISGEIAGEWFMRGTRIIRSRFVEIPRNNTRGVEDGNEVAQKEEAGCSQEL